MGSRRRPAVYPANDFYGSERIVRRAASWEHPIKAVIPHGVPLNPFYTHDQITLWPVPFILPYSWLTAEWASASAKHVAMSAAPFAYLVDRIDVVPPDARSAPRGSGLLVFPSHSSAVITAEPSSSETVRRLEQLRSEGWDCTVCMYWRDIELGRSIPFEATGFRIVTCGHREDQAFLDRLVELILAATMVAGDDFGSHMLYAAYLGRPYFSLTTPSQVRAPGTILDYYRRSPGPSWTRFRTDVPAEFVEIYDDLATAFGTTSTAPDLPLQQELARQFLGADNVLPTDELRAILGAAAKADRFDRHPPPGASRSPFAARQLYRSKALARRFNHRIA